MPMERRARRNVNQSGTAPGVCTDGHYKGYTRLHWIHAATQRDPGTVMHNLMHHLNQANLRRAFHSLDGSKASGIDHVTKRDYQQHLDHHLQALEQSLRGGGWRPQPAREVLIPKPQGGMRPLAVGCLEDKIVQTVVARILEAVYEPTFHRHSYGFRPGKSAHQALGRACETIRNRQRSCVVVEMDIEKFFDTVDHEWLIRTLAERIDDPHFLRLIRRLLRNATLHADGKLAEKLAGTPQGSPASPILANICLHALLDTWFVKHWADKGEFVRYADDAIFVFTDEAEARSFQQALGAHLAEAGLKLNLDKTRIVPFSASAPKGTITLLGFELYWGQHFGKGKRLKVKTIPKRLARAAQNFKDWIKAIRNRKTLASIWDMAAHKLVGHYNYYGVISNEPKLSHFYWSCVGSLYRWLNRRSQKRSYTWEQFLRRLRYSPLPRPPRGPELIDISSEHDAVRKHKPKSRMPKSGTYGSVRSASLKLVFT
jgi:RNA-directed DNA polymerase